MTHGDFLCYVPISYLVIWQNFVIDLAKFGPKHPVTLLDEVQIETFFWPRGRIFLKKKDRHDLEP